MNHLAVTPHLALDLDVFDRNARRMAQVIVRDGGKRWRPHVKSVRSALLARRLQSLGAHGVTCATASEAEAMVAGGLDDVLIASQVVQPADVMRVARLNRQAQVMVAVDSIAQMAPLAEAAANAGSRVPVLVELDVGLARAGVVSAAAAAALACQVQRHDRLQFRGLMAWEGHVGRVEAGAARRAAIEQAVALLRDAAGACAAAGLAAQIVSCGGTASFEVCAGLAGPTECQAGGGVFGDLRCRETFGVALEPALTLVATVLARPTPTRIVCDAGWKSLAVYPTPPRWRSAQPVASLAHAAEHLSITLQQPCDAPAVGQRIEFNVGYADATTFLHRRLHATGAGPADSVFELVATQAQAHGVDPVSSATHGECKHGK